MREHCSFLVRRSLKILNTVLLNEELDAIHNAGFHINGTDNVLTTFKTKTMQEIRKLRLDVKFSV